MIGWTFIAVTKEKGQKQVWTRNGKSTKRLPRKLKKKVTKTFIYRNRPETYSFGFWVKGLELPLAAFTGAVSSVMVFDRALSQKEVRQLYNHGKGIHYENLKKI